MARITITRSHDSLPRMNRDEVPVYALFGYPGKQNQLINLGMFDGLGLSLNVENGGLYVGHAENGKWRETLILGKAEVEIDLLEEEGNQEIVEAMVPSTVFADGTVDAAGKPKLYALIGYSEEVYRSHIGLDIMEDKIIPLAKKHAGRVMGRLTWNAKCV